MTNNLRSILKEKGISQKELASIIDVPIHKASRLVRSDRFTIDEVEKLCNGLSISPNDLLLENI